MQGLHVEHVNLGDPHRVLLENVNLKIKCGEILGIIGPNGAGKSTLIRTLSRFLPPLCGQIYLDGKGLNSLSQRELSRLIAVVPQNAIIPELFSAMDLVLMGRTPHLGLFSHEGEKDLEITRRVMQLTDTLHPANRIIKELSGGEKQRLLLARALAQEPKILLLDEPVANLDINHQVETLNLLRGLAHEQGLAVIIALHDLNLAVQYCDRLAILHNHRIQYEGKPETVVSAEVIREIFGAEVLIVPHPLNNLPVALVLPHDRNNNSEKAA